MQTIVEPSHVYHATDALTSGKLADFYESPRLYHRRNVTREWPRASSSAFGLGTLAHLFTLEPERACSVRTDAPVNPKTGRPYGADTDKAAEWRDNVHKEGGIAASEADVKAAMTIAEHVREVCLLLDVPLGPQGPRDGAMVEVTVRGTDPIVGLVQCRPDLWHAARRTVWDLKTTSNFDGFRHQARDLHYALKAAWYVELVQRYTGEECSFRWIVAESVAPYRVKLVSWNEQVAAHKLQVPSMLRRLASYRESGAWPLSYSGYEETL